jgi:CDP-4-dehydro-6-deoxyglucose reductase
MAAQVRILPSGHTFASEGNLNLLTAGLQAGLALGYGCSNGNCGKCLAKVVSGEVNKVQHHDYRISPEKKSSGHVLMCCNTAMTDVVLEASVALNASEIPQQQLTAKVKDITIVNDNVALLHLKTPRTNRLRFLAGQHVQLGGNDMPVANVSVGSCPCDDMNLHFHIPRAPADAFSEHVFNQLKKGDGVDVNGPDGNFVLNEDSPRSLIFIAWQTGFGPIRSLIEHAMALEVAETMHLVWIGTDKKDRYLDNLCRSWDDALDDFSYAPTDIGHDDRIDSIINCIFNVIGDLHNNLDDYDFYIAGNQYLTDSCNKMLLAHGVPSTQMMLDSITHG